MPETYSVPSEAAVNEAVEDFKKERKSYLKLPKNWAKDTEVVKKFHEKALEHFQTFAQSQARKDLMTYLKNADAKWRIAQATENRFKDDSTQKLNTLSHVSSGQLYKTVRLITAGQRTIVFSDPTELPAQYDPFPKCADYSEAEGKRIADGQNDYLKFVWYKEDWTTFIKKGLLHCNKNSMELVEMAWDFIQEKRPERVPGWFDAKGDPVEWTPEADNRGSGMYDVDGVEIPPETFLNEAGMPQSYVFVEKMREKRNWPVMTRHDLRNVYVDLQLDDIQKSTAIIIRDQCTFGELLAMQKQGYYDNVGKLTADQLFTTESKHNDTDLADKYDNADMTHEEVANGLFDRYRICMIAPITGDDKPKWDEEAIPEIHESVFVGPFEQTPATTPNPEGKLTGCVCLQLRKNPYHHKEFPFFLRHSHPEDDKGLVKLGYYTLLECNIEQQTVLVDTWNDNRTLAIKSPMVGEKGNVLEDDLSFWKNKVFWVKPGTGATALTFLKVPMVTADTPEAVAFFQKEADEIAGTLDAVRGEYAGSRTTATEVLGAREQAMKPAIEDCKAAVGPYLSWILRMTASLGRQFAPNRIHVASNEGQYVGEINPTLLYGGLATKVTAMDNYEADVATRQILVNFIQAGGYDRAAPFMGKDGSLYFWRIVAKRLKLPDPVKMFPEVKIYVEAINQANADYQYILINPQDAMVNPVYLPKMGEQHEVHITVLKPYSDRMKAIIKDVNPAEQEHYAAVIRALDFYILIHEQLKEQEAQQALATAPQLGAGGGGQKMLGPGGGNAAPMQAPTTPGMPGEAAGDMVSGLAQQAGGIE